MAFSAEKRLQQQTILLAEAQTRLCIAVDALEPVPTALLTANAPEQVQDLFVATQGLKRVLAKVNILLDARKIQ